MKNRNCYYHIKLNIQFEIQWFYVGDPGCFLIIGHKDK